MPVAVVMAAAGPAAAEPPRSLRLAVDGVLPFAAWDQTAGPGGGAGSIPHASAA